MSDYEIKVRARNNRILSLIRERGYRTIAAFCSAHNLGYSGVSQLVTMSMPATYANPNGDGTRRWRVAVLNLAEALGVDPSELFTERQASGGVREFTTLMHEDALLALAEVKASVPALETPEDVERRNDARRWLDDALASLTEREREIIESRFGLTGEEMTCERIAAAQSLSTTRIAQIEAKAIRKLRERAARRHRVVQATLADVTPRAAVAAERKGAA